MSRLLCALAAVVATLALAVTATAAPPERINDFELSVPDGTCPGVDLTFTLRGDIVIHTLSPTEEVQTFPSFAVNWSSPDGTSLTSRGPASARITYSDAAHTSIARTEVRGLLVAVTLPGHGVIWLEAGLAIFPGAFPSALQPIERHGPDGFRSQADYEAFCAYFV